MPQEDDNIPIEFVKALAYDLACRPDDLAMLEYWRSVFLPIDIIGEEKEIP